jgi:hypothetical protein
MMRDVLVSYNFMAIKRPDHYIASFSGCSGSNFCPEMGYPDIKFL